MTTIVDATSARPKAPWVASAGGIDVGDRHEPPEHLYRYAAPVSGPDRDKLPTTTGEFVRDPLANRAAINATRERSMAERLELAISWNKVAAELRDGMIRATEHGASRR